MKINLSLLFGVQPHSGDRAWGSGQLKWYGFILLFLEGLLGIAHLLWPEFTWGQGRDSYFNFNNNLTLASWLVSVQLLGIAILALLAFHRDRRTHASDSVSGWPWLLGTLAALAFSVAEMTRIHQRLEFFGGPQANVYQQFIVFSLGLILLTLAGWFLLRKLQHAPDFHKFSLGWLVAWGLQLMLARFAALIPAGWQLWYSFVTGLAYLFGSTLLLMAVGGYALRAGTESHSRPDQARSQNVSLAEGRNRSLVLVGVGGTTFTLIFLQIILFQLLTIFSNYLTANSVISIALLGSSVGGLIGFFAARKAPLSAMIAASMLLPLAILLAFGTAVMLMSTPLIASLFLMVPFACSSVVITIALVKLDSHLAYFGTLIGSGLGALLVSVALTNLREESSLLFLAAFTFLVAASFIAIYPNRRTRKGLLLLVAFGIIGLAAMGTLNLRHDWLNVVRTQLEGRYPQAEFFFSESSLVGRYDVIRREPGNQTLKAYENGRTTDTIRNLPAENYQIDPRLPHTLMENPTILILGLSGDGITKTSTFLSDSVYGVEINPIVVSAQVDALAEYNGDSYAGIEVTVTDGRSYIEQSNQTYDIITLLNTHFTRGGHPAERASDPEYLYTKEAIHEYLDHLADDGIVNIEDPIARPAREPPVWKLLLTMRQVLLERGFPNPEQHFFVFQWRTNSNNYYQVLMKKKPFSGEEITSLMQWLDDVDHVREIGAAAGQRVGPITTATTTVLHLPGESISSNVSRIVRGDVDERFLQAHNLQAITDNRPFLFDVDPARPLLRQAYTTTALMVLLLIPILIWLLARHSASLSTGLPYVFTVALTGVGFLLLETVLIQRYTIFLGSPVATFASVLGTLLIFSGLGSLWSRRIGQSGVYRVLAAILGLLLIHLWVVPATFSLGASLPLLAKIVVTSLSIAPLAFLLGVPFPFVLRTGKVQLSETTAATLFAANAAASALAVPQTLNVATAFGLNAAFQMGIVIYGVVALMLVAMHKPRVRRAANGVAALTISLLFIAPWLASRPAPTVAAASADQYLIYGASYGESLFREDRVFLGGSSSGFVRFEWLFWILQAEGRTVLVDTGFNDAALAEQWGIQGYVHPFRRLYQLGLSPLDVSDVILTHAHWDHMGGLAAYPNANLWIQETEYQHARSVLRPANPESNGMRWEDLQNLLAAEAEGRLHLVRGEESPLPGITMTLAGGHTPGSQFVTVETLDGPVVIAGDNTYMYRNNRSHIPIGGAFDHDANLKSIETMQSRASSPFLILPGHDPRVMTFFPQVAEGVVHITFLSE